MGRVGGAGPTGCAVAARLAENLIVGVLLIEAGGSDAVQEVLQKHLVLQSAPPAISGQAIGSGRAAISMAGDP
jgi:choline dehydrogenase-like flavoprotein